ncbi:hypothetical protein GAYE_SCF18G3834 [Galdieria yellowstonensis]|jgi:hypothetical protein|uniref:Uncharacterized protein n=1 Tax=Galdieria yellowstonensis TaxID=3028027 RepID=A0AAV9IEP2_9RHOD|nr:hypothetical protein GAYE_SCF18G3834 [Galdieria yellowstonensis]
MSSPFWPIFRRVVPLGFLGGCCIELFMLHVRIGSETFYDTAKRKEIERRMERLREEEANAGTSLQGTADSLVADRNNEDT